MAGEERLVPLDQITGLLPPQFFNPPESSTPKVPAERWVAPESEIADVGDYNIKNYEQGVSLKDRIETQNLFDTPEQQVKFLNSLTNEDGTPRYQAMIAKGRVVVKDPNNPNDLKVLDPKAGIFNPIEGLKELGDNLNVVPQLFAGTNPLVGAAVGAVSELARQGIRELVAPDVAEFDPLSVGVNAGAGFLGGVVGKGKGAATGAIEDATSAVTQRAPGVLSKLKEYFGGPESIARELGVVGKEVNPDLGSPIIKNIEWLKENSPEFLQAINKTTIKGKSQALVDLKNEAAKKISNFYKEADVDIPVSEVFNTKAYRDLTDAAIDSNLPRNVRIRINNVRKSVDNTIADKILTPEELKFYNRGKLHEMPRFQDSVINDNESALKYLTEGHQDRSISLSDMFKIKQGRDDLVNYGKKQMDLDPVNEAQGNAANIFRETIAKYLTKNAAEIPDAEMLLHLNEFYHNIVPVSASAGRYAGNVIAAGMPPVGRFIGGTISGPVRFAATTAQRLSSVPGVAGTIRNAVDALDTAGGVLSPIMKAGGAILGNNAGSRGLGYLASKRILDNQLGSSVPDKEGEGFYLPRQTDRFFSLSDNDLLVSGLSEEEVNKVSEARHFGSQAQEKVLAEITSSHTNDGMFETSPLKGWNAVQKTDGSWVITDPLEATSYAEQLRQEERRGGKSSLITKKLSALNKDGTVLLDEPPKPLTSGQVELHPTPTSSLDTP